MASRFWVYSLVSAIAITAWVAAPQSASLSIQDTSNKSAAPVQKSGRLPQPLRPLPVALERPTLEAAVRDPFAMVAPPAPVVVPQKPVQVVAPPPPSPPPLNLRFTGRMTAPDGSQVIFVALGETAMSLSVGQTLPNGYKVDAINERTVELSYLPMNFTTRFDLPAPPRYQIR